MQALASLIEPLLTRTWGGRPSEHALTQGLGNRYFSAEDGKRVREKLIRRGTPDASDQSLFYIAMQIAETSGSSRVPRFNVLYAYHRALVLVSLLAIIFFIFSLWGGVASRLTWVHNVSILALLIALLILFWNRTRQRAIYYVREVLLCAERELEDK